MKELPTIVKKCISYSGAKLSSQFQIKDESKKMIDLACYVKYPGKHCIKDYMAGTGRYLINWMWKEHSGRNEKWQLFKHPIQTKHKTVLKG